MPNPVKVPELMQDFISWIEKETVHRVRYAIEAHYKFVSIHPFTDGNGRTARLLMNLILNKAGYPALIIPKELRSGYVISLEKSQTTEETDEHNQFMYERMIDSMKEYIRMVTGDM